MFYSFNPINKMKAGFDFANDVILQLIITHSSIFAYKLDLKVVAIVTLELLSKELNNQKIDNK